MKKLPLGYITDTVLHDGVYYPEKRLHRERRTHIQKWRFYERRKMPGSRRHPGKVIDEII
ncbi:hypothetical protein ABDK09_12535 [Vibrio sp. CDRSL-10 TSBA]